MAIVKHEVLGNIEFRGDQFGFSVPSCMFWVDVVAYKDGNRIKTLDFSIKLGVRKSILFWKVFDLDDKLDELILDFVSSKIESGEFAGFDGIVEFGASYMPDYMEVPEEDGNPN